MKKPKNTPVEEEEVLLEDLTPLEFKQVVNNLSSLIRSNTLEKSSEAEQSDPKGGELIAKALFETSAGTAYR